MIPVRRDVPVLSHDEPIGAALRKVLDSDLPALPVVDGDGRYAGIFGEREFIAAVFPGYMKQLGYAGFVPKSLDHAIEQREGCELEPVAEHMNTEHVDLASDYSEAAVAETFLHHRISVLPITEDGRVVGVLTRGDFVRALAERTAG